MPCNSDYLDATDYEREISRVACLLDELAGKKWTRDSWNGYHPKVYRNVTRTMGDAMVRELCSALQCRGVKAYSLEMQIWWRDHQIADNKRLKRQSKN